MDLAARLHAEAQATNERRMLVLAGSGEATRNRAGEVVETLEVAPSEVTFVGPKHGFSHAEADPSDVDAPDADVPYEHRSHDEVDALLGTTRDVVVLDCHDRCEPNVLGSVTGVVDGGGLLVLCTPSLSEWPQRRDAFDETLAVPPFERTDVSGFFRRRLVDLLETHRGIALVSVAADGDDTVLNDGLTDPPPRRGQDSPTIPETYAFPRGAYEACLTQDQVSALEAFERLREGGNALVVEADRGRGKSSVAGLAAASLAADGFDVLVTAPRFRNARELFARARELRTEGAETNAEQPADETVRTSDREIQIGSGRVRFRPPLEARDLPGDPDTVVVDEAAALPVDVLRSFLGADGVAFTTTIHGYEGAGRGFSVRFRDHLEESAFDVTDVSLTEPIRYAPADPVEVWSFRALALDARPPVAELVADATPASVTYCELTPEELLEDEQLLREVFGLLVLAHYRTEPNDLARLLDAPNVSVHTLCQDGHPVSVALLAREGGVSERLQEAMYRGERVPGNMLPDVLAGQLRDPEAAAAVGQRVLRIATHSAARSRGLGSRLVEELRDRCEADWLGVGYGATPELVSFWEENGFDTVHVATSRNDRSGEHSVLMLDPRSPAGEAIRDRHTEWFLGRFPATLTDSLSELDADVVRAVCRACAGTPDLDLSRFEWRIATGMADGAAILATAPRPIRVLTLRYLTDPDVRRSGRGPTDDRDSGAGSEPLTEREQRLLVRKALQCHSWERVREDLSYPGGAACMRALGAAVETLVDLYGPDDSDAVEWSP